MGFDVILKKKTFLSYFAYKISLNAQKLDKKLADIPNFIFRNIEYNNSNSSILLVKANKIKFNPIS